MLALLICFLFISSTLSQRTVNCLDAFEPINFAPYNNFYNTFQQDPTGSGTSRNGGQVILTFETIIITSTPMHDGNAKLLIPGLAETAYLEDHNVLAFDGPGQGSTVRSTNLIYRPDYEFVIRQVVQYVVTLPNVDRSKLVLWGVSFGGFLAPRAFSFMPELNALVANIAIYDFYEVFVCELPSDLFQILTTNKALFNELYNTYETSLNLNSLSSLNFLYLGFGVSDPASLYLALEPYIQPNMNGMGNRPILANNPLADVIMGNQSGLFWSHLPFTNPPSKIFSLDPNRGGGLLYSVGSNYNLIGYIMQWLNSVFPEHTCTPPTTSTSTVASGLSIGLSLLELRSESPSVSSSTGGSVPE